MILYFSQLIHYVRLDILQRNDSFSLFERKVTGIDGERGLVIGDVESLALEKRASVSRNFDYGVFVFFLARNSHSSPKGESR